MINKAGDTPPNANVGAQPAEDGKPAGAKSGLVERLGQAAGQTVARVSATVDQVVNDPKQAGQELLDVARRNPGKTLAVAGVTYLGLGTAAAAAVVGGVVGAGAGVVRTAQHMGDGKSLSEAVQATGEEAVELKAKAADLGQKAVAEAKKTFGVFAGWLNKGGGDKA